jgi:hypothetical protein
MKRYEVKSSLIRTIGYDPKKEVLEVEFAKDGAVYQYEHVGMDVFEQLASEEVKTGTLSAGALFTKLIKKNPSKYPFKRVEEEESGMLWDEEEEKAEISAKEASLRWPVVYGDSDDVKFKPKEISKEEAIVVLTRKIQTIPEQAKALVIKSNEQYIGAAELLKVIKTLEAEVDSTHDPVVQHWHEKHKAALAVKKADMEPLVVAEGLVKLQIGVWLREQEMERRAEEERIRRENEERIRAQAEEENLKEAERLAAEGDLDGAAEVIDAEVVIPVIPVKVESKVPSIAGLSARKMYKAQLVDLMNLVKAVALGAAPLEALQVNTAFLNAQARAFKKPGVLYPGVVIVEEDSVASGRL